MFLMSIPHDFGSSELIHYRRCEGICGCMSLESRLYVLCSTLYLQSALIHSERLRKKKYNPVLYQRTVRVLNRRFSIVLHSCNTYQA